MSKKHNPQKTVSTTKNLQLALANKYWWSIPILAVILYANTIFHGYTQDDAIVIYDNMYTTEGVSGIPELLRYDTFRGFFKTEGKAKLVSGGRYRPFTPVMFALEYELFGRSPLVGHLINILLYAFLGLMIFLVLRQMLTPLFPIEAAGWIALGTALLYMAHPLHTEAVANIKGRDEIMAMLASISSFWYALKYYDQRKLKFLIISFFLFFIGLLSKENTITYLAIWPIALIIFRKGQGDFKFAFYPWMAMIMATAVFLGIRTFVLGFDVGGTPMELMNNPYLKLVGDQYVSFSFPEKMATIMYTLGKYITLLVFPHPLTHDYYPRYIELMSWSDIKVIASSLMYVLMGVLTIFYWKRNPIISFCILYFLCTLSIVSNIVFPIGTNMSERFMFMPSLGFCLFLSWFIVYKLRTRFGKNGVIILLGVILCLYSIKTISRNIVWKNDFTLFTTDVKTSYNSAKVLNAAGGALCTEAFKLEEGTKKTKMLREAVGYLNKAMEVHPKYKNPALILGNAHYYLKEYDLSIAAYQRALNLDPDYTDAQNNLAVALRDAGRVAGEKEQNFTKALQYLKRSYQLTPDDLETIRLLGVASGLTGDHTGAIKYFKMVVNKSPSKDSYENLGRAHANNGDPNTAQEMFDKAAQLTK